MALPQWITPSGNLGIIPSLGYYQFALDAYDASGGILEYKRVSGTLPPGIQVVKTGALQGIPVSTADPDLNVTYTFTIRVTNTATLKIADRSFSITVTNVAPPVIIPKNQDLGIYLDGAVVDIQLTAVEFILEDTISWALKSGTLPPGITLSTSGKLSGYIQPIPAVGPAGDPGWADTAWDLLGWDFPLGASKKLFTFTLEVTDGVNYDQSTYTLLVYPKSGLTADSNTISVDTNYILNNIEPKHYPIILTTQDDLVPQRQGGYFSFKIKAIDLDDDDLEYIIPSIQSGAFDEQDGISLPYLATTVTDGNVYIGTVSISNPSKPALVEGDQIQILYRDLSTNLTDWHSANVNNFTTVRLTGNTIITGSPGQYITQPISGANATISNISKTFGIIRFGNEIVAANVGDVITQATTGANATVTSSSYSTFATVRYNSGTFSIGSGNILVNGTVLIKSSFNEELALWSNVGIVPNSATYQADIKAAYNTVETFTLGSTSSSAITLINGISTNAYPLTILSIGVDINGLSLQGTIGFDDIDGRFDQGSLELPLAPLPNTTSIIDSRSGWITGLIPPQTANETTYTFEVQVRKADYPSYSTSQIYTITILGDLNNTITWLTPNDLGSIQNGEISDLYVQAISSKGKTLYYEKTSNDRYRLPQGLLLTSNGLISGRVSFEVFTLDQGNTTTDINRTTFDDTYTFSITARDFNNTTSATRTFKIQVIEANKKPYENLYLKALLSQEQRAQFQDLIQNQDIFPIESIYRLEDPFYGVTKEIRPLILAGLNPNTLSDYANAVETNHYTKRLTFGPVQTAVARDGSYDVIDIATSAVVGTFRDNIGFIPTDFSLGYLPSKTIPVGAVLGSEHIKYEVVYAEILDDNTTSAGESPADIINLSNKITNPYYDTSGNSYTIAYPNSFGNMQGQLVGKLGYANKGALPDWMTTTQPNGSVLGFKRAVVLAYAKEGAGNAMAWRFNQSGFNLNQFDFTVDRYELSNIYTENFNIVTNAFNPGFETTFDRYPTLSTLFNPIGTIDYAVNIAFDRINSRTKQNIISNGGLDGVYNFRDGQTLIFFEQEFYTGQTIGDTYNQGWSNVTERWDGDEWDLNSREGWDEALYVPGFNENLLNPLIANQRIGIWRINISEDDVVTLTFVQTMKYYDKVYVRRGFTHGATNIYYNPIIKQNKLIPNYSVIPQQIQTLSTRFDGNGTRFVNNRDEYTVPGIGDKYIKFANTGVFT